MESLFLPYVYMYISYNLTIECHDVKGGVYIYIHVMVG